MANHDSTMLTHRPVAKANGTTVARPYDPRRYPTYTLNVLIKDEHMRRTLQRSGYRLRIGDLTRDDRNDWTDGAAHRMIHPITQPLGKSSANGDEMGSLGKVVVE